jgi:hypothetical protein
MVQTLDRARISWLARSDRGGEDSRKILPAKGLDSAQQCH